MKNRLRIVWLCSTLLCSCSLDSTPRTGSDAGSSSDRHGPGWKPAGSNTSGNSTGGSSSVDSDSAVAANPASDGGSDSKPSDAASGGSGKNDQAKDDQAKDDQAKDDQAKDDQASKSDPAPPSSDAAGASGGANEPAAPGSGQQPTDGASRAAGSGGASGASDDQGKDAATNDNSTDTAGAGGAAGAEDQSVRERFIEAAIDALGGDSGDTGGGGKQDGGTETWRRSGSSAGGLSPEFVLPVLRSMRNSTVCFREVRRCVEMCVVLASDCKPCASDPECGEALKDVCGSTIGNCGNP